MKTVAFTSSAVNYLPKVRKLVNSIKKYHPEFEVVWALSDELHESINADAELIDEVVALTDLDISDRIRWTFS